MPMDPQREALAFAPERRTSKRTAPGKQYFRYIPAALKAQLFTVPDTWIAEAVGCHVAAVRAYRRSRNIPALAGADGRPGPGRAEWVAEMKRRLAEPGNSHR